MIRVLITGCSMHSYDLIRALKDNYDGEEIYVVGINCDDTALLRKGVDAGYVVPRITEESYIPTVIDICEKEKVDVILPFITTVTALINWWYNNSFTQAAMEADKTYDRMKQNGF